MQTVLMLLQIAGLGFFGWCVYICFTQCVGPGSEDASEAGVRGGGAPDGEVDRDRGAPVL
jgi:hypothetical protein